MELRHAWLEHATVMRLHVALLESSRLMCSLICLTIPMPEEPKKRKGIQISQVLAQKHQYSHEFSVEFY